MQNVVGDLRQILVLGQLTIFHTFISNQFSSMHARVRLFIKTVIRDCRRQKRMTGEDFGMGGGVIVSH